MKNPTPLAILFLLHSITTYAGENKAYVEFLWKPIPINAIARQQTIGFLLDEKEKHQVCVAVIKSDTPPPYKLSISAINQDGKVIFKRVDKKYIGKKKCYNAIRNNPNARPGIWTYIAYLNDRYAGEDQIEVARNFKKAAFYSDPKVPYVLGRPNYDESIPPSQWEGRLVWDIHVNANGNVTKVEVKVAEGVGKKIADRAIAAGYISLFPPDPSLGAGEFVYKRELKFTQGK
ncbi:hypothetical protein [Xanthomonas albilineans]|uniref:hypothetical protein n=1 Tax=Xanthomonas albilineans TaxID=29447 RepID=UPI000AC4933A|nr:hypothetical protein [Xanthomonas albilineans]